MKTNPLILRIVLGVGILLLAVFSALPLIPPHAVSADAPATSFSAERAMVDLAVIAKEPHGAGSDAQARVREYIVAQVAALGLTAEIQASGPLSNILVRLPGTDSTGTVLVTGHYDSHPPAPGAGDDSISVAAMLEAVRVLRANPSLRNDVLFLFTDAEELGWQGAIAFIRENPEVKQESVILCFDALPGSAPLLLQETSPGDAWLLRQIAGLPISAWGSSWKRDQERNEQDTDFDTFAPAGYAGLIFENEASGTRYHTNRDTVDAISPDLVQSYGQTMLILTRRFGTVDLRTRTSGPDLTYFVLPLIGLVTHPGWVMPLLSSFGLLSLLSFIIVGWRKKHFSLGRFALSLLGLLAGIALMVVLAQMAWGVIVKKYAAEISAYDGFESSPIWLSMLMASATVLMILLLSLLSRKLGGVNVTAAAPVIFLFLGFTFALLDGSDNPLTLPWFVWALIGCVAGLGILLFVKKPAWKFILLLCSAYLTLAVTLPWIVLATYTREGAWLPVLVISAWMGLFAPQVEAVFGRALALENNAEA